MFDSDEARFNEVGFNIGILRPGEPNCMYHAEDAQEDFLVLSGECLLIVEGEERPLKAWDFVHCPPMDRARLRRGRRRSLRCGRRWGSPEGPRSPLRTKRDRTEIRRRSRGGDLGFEIAYARFAEDKPITCPEEFPAG